MGNPSRNFKTKQEVHPNQNETVETVTVKNNRWVRKPETLARFALSDSSLYEKISKKQFPAPYHPYGPRISVWLESELDEHMAQQLKTIGKVVIS